VVQREGQDDHIFQTELRPAYVLHRAKHVFRRSPHVSINNTQIQSISIQPRCINMHVHYCSGSFFSRVFLRQLTPTRFAPALIWTGSCAADMIQDNEWTRNAQSHERSFTYHYSQQSYTGNKCPLACVGFSPSCVTAVSKVARTGICSFFSTPFTCLCIGKTTCFPLLLDEFFV